MTVKTGITEVERGSDSGRKGCSIILGPTDRPFSVESCVITFQTLPLAMTVQWKLAA